MVSDTKYVIYKYFLYKIYRIIKYDLTEGRIQKNLLAYTNNEVKTFLIDNRQNIDNTIADILSENGFKDVEFCEKITDDIVKAILYEYVIYDE